MSQSAADLLQNTLRFAVILLVRNLLASCVLAYAVFKMNARVGVIEAAVLRNDESIVTYGVYFEKIYKQLNLLAYNQGLTEGTLDDNSLYKSGAPMMLAPPPLPQTSPP